jgi:signal transduction histidine kinase
MLSNQKRNKNFLSLADNLTFTFFVFTAVLLIVSGFFVLYFSFINQREIVIERQNTIARDAANVMDGFIEEKFGLLGAICSVNDLVGLDSESRKLVLEKLLGAERSFRQLTLLDASGKELINVSRLPSILSGGLKERSGSQFYLNFDLEGDYTGSVFVDEITGEPMIIMAVLIKDVFGDLGGALLAEVNLKFMWELANSIKVGQNGLAYVIDDQGRLMAFKDTARVLMGENVSYLTGASEFVDNDKINSGNMAKASVGIQGNYVVANHARLEKPNWAVVVELPVWEAYGYLITGLLFISLVILLVFGLSVAGVLLLSRRITRPLKILQEAAIEIGNGNLDKKIEVESTDEIGDLALAFNSMAAHLKRQKERDKAVSRMKSEFVSIVAHQLRGPLSSLKWTFDLIKNGSLGSLTQEQEEYLGNCRKANDKMIDTVNDLLDLTRIEEGRFLYEYSKIEIEDLIQGVLDNSKIEASRRKVNIEFKKEDVPTLMADEEKIIIVVKNLLENALNYTPAGGRVDISFDQKPKEVIVKIKDTGIGIPQDQQKNVFNKFFRAKNALSVETSGSGLGLYIAKNIVEKHGGRIWFESAPDQGTTFYFTLPLKK